MATTHEVNRIREGAAGQIIVTKNGVSTWVSASEVPEIQAAQTAAQQAQSEVDALETVVATVETTANTAATTASAAQTAAQQAQSEVDALETVVADVQAAFKPIFKTVRVGQFANMTGKTQHLVLPTGVNLYSLEVWKDGLLYAETDDYTQVSNSSGVSVTNMEAYENVEVLQFRIIVTDAASRQAVLDFWGTTNYTGQYPN